MITFSPDSSPFLVLWYFFLVFFGIVIAVNILVLIIRRFLEWRIARLMKKTSAVKPTKKAAK